MPLDRRAVLAGAAATLAGPVVAQPAELRGTVTMLGGGAIAPGTLVVALEDPARQAVARIRVASDGKSPAIGFALPAASAAARVVVRLERADGWLLARGSAAATPAPVEVVIAPVMY